MSTVVDVDAAIADMRSSFASGDSRKRSCDEPQPVLPKSAPSADRATSAASGPAENLSAMQHHRGRQAREPAEHSSESQSHSSSSDDNASEWPGVRPTGFNRNSRLVTETKSVARRGTDRVQCGPGAPAAFFPRRRCHPGHEPALPATADHAGRGHARQERRPPLSRVAHLTGRPRDSAEKKVGTRARASDWQVGAREGQVLQGQVVLTRRPTFARSHLGWHLARYDDKGMIIDNENDDNLFRDTAVDKR